MAHMTLLLVMQQYMHTFTYTVATVTAKGHSSRNMPAACSEFIYDLAMIYLLGMPGHTCVCTYVLYIPYTSL